MATPTDDYQIFRVSKLGRTVRDLSPELQQQVRGELFAVLALVRPGGRLVIDFRDVTFFSPTLMLKLITEFISDSIRQKQGLFRGRFLAAKDLDPDLRFMVESILHHIHGSLYVFYNDTEDKTLVREEVLNVPDYLSGTLSTIADKGPIASADLAEHLGSKKDSAREYVRKLYRRGLLKRTAVGTEEGIRYFVYEKFTMRSTVGGGEGSTQR